MYAIKTHINKVMAVFLCACLLLSFNPAFGQVGVAQALEAEVPSQGEVNAGTSSGNGASGIQGTSGEATTDINVRTFDGSLRTESTDSFSATVEDIKNTPGLQTIQVNATSSQGNAASDFSYTWTVSRDGEAAQAIPAGVQPPTFDASKMVCTGSVSLTGLIGFAPGFFANGHEYVFTCVVQCGVDKDGNPVKKTETITIVTVDEGDYENPEPGKPVPPDPTDPDNPNPEAYAKRLDAESGDGTVALIYAEEGGFRKGAVLQSAEMTPADQQNHYGKLFEEATLALPKPDGFKDFEYELGRIQVNEITGAQVSPDGGTLPAYLGDLTMMIPLTNVQDEDGEDRYKYAEGDKIYVLYQQPGDTTNVPKFVEATVVRDPEGGALKAMFGIDKTTGPFMPGYFAVAYAPNKTDVDNDKDPVSSFTVTATKRGTGSYGQIVTSADLPKGTWKTGSSATYRFQPAASTVTGNTITYYTLKTLTFQKAGGTEREIYAGGATLSRQSVDGVYFGWDNDNKTLSLMNCAAHGEYFLTATFERNTKLVTDLGDPKTDKVHVSIVDENGGSDIGDSAVGVTYWKNESTQAVETVNRGTSGAGTDNGFVVDALKLSQMRFDVNVGGDAGNGETYYLKEIRSGSSVDAMKAQSIEPITETSEMTVNGETYRQFVIGKRAATYVPPTTLKATVQLEGGAQGTITDPDATNNGRTVVRDFTPFATGSQVTFKANPGYYASTVSAVDTASGAQIYSALDLGNSKAKENFTWKIFTNYTNNITYTVHFDPKPQVDLFTLEVGTIANGTVAPSGWTLDPAGYEANTSLSFSVKPDEGYKLDGGKIYALCADGERIEMVVSAGVATLVMPAKNVVGIQASFVPIPSTEKPTVTKQDFKLNLFVADSSSTIANALNYAVSGTVSKDEMVGSGDGNVSLNGYAATQGTINGVSENPISTTVTATSANGYPSYPLSMKASENYEVEKILVAQYRNEGGKKQLDSRTLYYHTWPTFDVTDIKGDTDVIVYFREVTSENPPTYDPGDIEWVTVDTDISRPTYAVAAFSGAVQVVKGQGFENRITPKSGYRWTELFWEDDNGDGEILEVSGSANAQSVSIDSVKANTMIYATLARSNKPVVPTYALSASGTDNGVLRADIGANWRNLGLWEDIDQGTEVKLTAMANTGYVLSELKFNIDSDSVYAFVQMTDERNTLRFMASNTSPGEGWEAYTSGQAIVQAANTREVVWYVENLDSNMTVIPTFVKSDGSGETPGPDDPTLDPKNYWTVDAVVGEGSGTITSPDAPNGFPMKVLKDPEKTVKVYFNPGQTSDGRDYVVENVTVDRTTGNILEDAWQTIIGLFGGSNAQDLAKQAMAQGFVELTVDANYNIVVDFKIKDSQGGADDRDDNVVVNVKGDPLKGRVMPPAPLTLPKSGDNSKQQFIVDTKLDPSTDKYYSVANVVVRWFENGASKETVRTITPDMQNDSLVKWDVSYANVFTLDVGSLGLDPTNLHAVTVEVNYSESGDTSGGFGGGSSETPPLGEMKKVTIDVMADGVAVGGTSNTGGVVAPKGEFYLMQQKIGNTDEYARQLVVVSPAAGYTLTKITVNGTENKDYLEQVTKDNAGFFYISTEDLSEEKIVVYFEQLNIEERAITVTTKVVNEDANHTGKVVTGKPVMLQPGQKQFYDLVPTAYGTSVTKIEDKYNAGTAEDPLWVDVPESIPGNNHWTRTPDSPLVYNNMTVMPLAINGKYVDRQIVVHFGAVGNDPNADLSGNQPKANIKVCTWGNGRSKLNLTPYASLIGITKGQGAQYTWNMNLPASAYEADKDGGAYRIFCVDVNGTEVFGSKTKPTREALTGEYSVTFNDANMKQGDNTLDIYVRYFTKAELTGSGSNKPGGTIEGGIGSGGSVVDGTTGAVKTFADTSNKFRAIGDGTHDGATGGDGNDGEGDIGGGEGNTPDEGGDPDFGEVGGGDYDGDETIGGDEADVTKYVKYFVPPEGFVIDQVYTSNCTVDSIEWLVPRDVPADATQGSFENDPRTETVALKCDLSLVEKDQNGFVYVTCRKLADGETFKPFDKDEITDKNKLDHTMVVELTPEKVYDDLAAGTITDLTAWNNRPELLLGGSLTNNKHAMSFVTVAPDQFDAKTGEFKIEVGSLIKWNKTDESKSVLYTVDADALARQYGDKVKLEDKRDQAAIDANKPQEADKKGASEGNSEKPEYFARYAVSGNVKDLPATNKLVNLTIPLKSLALEDGTFPEFQKQDANNPGGPDDPNVTYTLTTKVNNVSYGSLTPVAVDGDKWFGDASSGAQWTVKAGTKVAFDVKPSNGYRLTSLKRNGTVDCIRESEYSTSLKRVSFTVNGNTTLDAVFDTNENARVPVTVQVVGGHGSTSPTPGTYQAPVGEDFAIYFDPDSGYVIDTVKVITDGTTETHTLSATQSGFRLNGQKLWQATTVQISYKLAGTSGGNSSNNGSLGGNTTQAGQNTANGADTSLIKTGDSLLLAAVLLVVAGGATVAVLTLRRRKAAALRAAKYSVTRRR